MQKNSSTIGETTIVCTFLFLKDELFKTFFECITLVKRNFKHNFCSKSYRTYCLATKVNPNSNFTYFWLNLLIDT
jgi:hypothetical protein